MSFRLQEMQINVDIVLIFISRSMLRLAETKQFDYAASGFAFWGKLKTKSKAFCNEH